MHTLYFGEEEVQDLAILEKEKAKEEEEARRAQEIEAKELSGSNLHKKH